MGTNCAPLFADLLLYSYEADFVADLTQKKENLDPLVLVSAIDDVLSFLVNPSFGDFIHRMQPQRT